MSYFLRLLTALLLLTLPFAASATAAEVEPCHEFSADGAAAPGNAAAAADHAYHPAQSPSGEYQGCDCSEHCSCPQHCSGSCAAVMSGTSGINPALSTYAGILGNNSIPDCTSSSLFRPPIPTLA